MAALADELTAYHAYFAPLFQRRAQRAWAAVDRRGLLRADVPRKNVEALALRLRGAGPQAAKTGRALPQFIGAGAWDDSAILAAPHRLVDETRGEDDGVLISEGSDLPQHGRPAVGVARPWGGATGKTDTCQAGVYLGYASRRGYTVLDRRRSLHAAWCAEDQQDRWRACALPDGVRVQTKVDVAAELVEGVGVQRPRRVRARWLTCAAGSGQDPALRDRVAATSLWYLAAVPGSTRVWPVQDLAPGLDGPRPWRGVPPTPSGRRGRSVTQERLHPDRPRPVRVDTLLPRIPAPAWRRYRILEGRNGPRSAACAARRVVTTRHRLPGPELWVLFRRAVKDPTEEAGEEPEVKIYLSNAPPDIPLGAWVRVSGLRWPSEACVAEGQGDGGLDHDELRAWRGWHHHMTLVILAHHVLVRMQQRLTQRGGACAAPRAPGPARVPGPARGAPPPAPGSRRVEPDPRPSPATGRAAAAHARHRRHPGPRVLPAAAQGGRLLLPAQAPLAPTRPASSAVIKVSL